ncbi:hypothetical protein A2963_00360 [Candidatus Roizmanbacteria bacterium RIFCSPLOWO2_01_FULL_40_13]|nr:MAG: hypothetical protein A2963_00360 [Candidatus Roizmanbacteria bacterium RIFCSPLOWO2_01_FULL_40_13]
MENSFKAPETIGQSIDRRSPFRARTLAFANDFIDKALRLAKSLHHERTVLWDISDVVSSQIAKSQISIFSEGNMEVIIINYYLADRPLSEGYLATPQTHIEVSDWSKPLGLDSQFPEDNAGLDIYWDGEISFKVSRRGITESEVKSADITDLDTLGHLLTYSSSQIKNLFSQ